MLKINNNILESPRFVLTNAGDIQVAKKRITEDVTVYGANGSYTVYDGAYESSDRVLEISVSDFNNIIFLDKILKDKENVIEFDYLSNSKFYADLLEFKYAKQGNKRWLVSLNFRFDPFRYTYDSGVTTLVKSGTVTNIGDVYSEPIIEIEGSGEVSLTIGSQTMVLKLDTKATIDCRHRKQNTYDKNGNVKNSIRVRGGFFELPTGRLGVATSGNVTSIKIYGNWRFRV